MKAIIKSTALVFGLMIALNIKALIVSDPTSYTHYIEQLKTLKEQAGSLQQQVEQGRHFNIQFDTYLDDLREEFNFNKNIDKSLSDQYSEYQEYVSSLTKLQQKELGFNNKYQSHRARDVIDVNLDGLFVDPQDPTFNTDNLKKYRHYERQKFLKEALIKSEQKIVALEDSFKRMDDLVEQSKKTKSLKASSDLNNAILVEILAALNTLIELTAHQGKAEMAAEYVHYSQQKHQNEMAAFKRRYPKGRCFRGKCFKSEAERLVYKQKCIDYKRRHGHSDIAFDGYRCPGMTKRMADEDAKKRTVNW